MYSLEDRANNALRGRLLRSEIDARAATLSDDRGDGFRRRFSKVAEKYEDAERRLFELEADVRRGALGVLGLSEAAAPVVQQVEDMVAAERQQLTELADRVASLKRQASHVPEIDAAQAQLVISELRQLSAVERVALLRKLRPEDAAVIAALQLLPPIVRSQLVAESEVTSAQERFGAQSNSSQAREAAELEAFVTAAQRVLDSAQRGAEELRKRAHVTTAPPVVPLADALSAARGRYRGR